MVSLNNLWASGAHLLQSCDLFKSVAAFGKIAVEWSALHFVYGRSGTSILIKVFRTKLSPLLKILYYYSTLR